MYGVCVYFMGMNESIYYYGYQLCVCVCEMEDSRASE